MSAPDRAGASDEELLSLSAGRDMAAFETLVSRYQRRLLNFVYHYLHKYDDSEDILQQIFFKVFKNASKFSGDRGFKSWIFRISYNEVMDHLRSVKRKGAGPPVFSLDEKEIGEINPGGADGVNPDSPDLLVNRRLENEKIHGLLGTLEAKYRDPVILRHFHHLSYVEIGEVLNVPEGTVKTNIHRGRQALRKLIEDNSEYFSELSF